MKEVLIIIAVIILVIGIIFLLYKYKKEYLKVLAYYSVVQAEELYKSKEGQEKLAFAIRSIKNKLPWWLSWVISEKIIRSTIESVLKNLQSTFKGAKEKQIALLDNIISYGASPEHLTKLQMEVNDNGYVEGYLEARTDLKGNNNIIGGIRAGAKF